jgi:hypothetical protein
MSSKMVAVIIATLLMVSVTAASAGAQALPFKAYGSGLRPGAVVEAFNGSVSAGRAVVDGNGNWQIDLLQPVTRNGDVVRFHLDGLLTAQTITFSGGMFVPVPGLVLTVPAGTLPLPTGTLPVPRPANTGTAGLGDQAPSIALAIALSVVAITFVAGGRMTTSRSRARLV